MITFKVKDWFDYLPKEFTVKIYPGYTPLIGKNGSGKTTLLHQIKEYVRKNQDYCFIEYSNYTDGGNTAIDRYLNVTGQMDKFALAACSSEGQRIMINAGDIFGQIGSVVRDKSNNKKIVILFDALDSGTSIDNIREFVRLFHLIVEDAKKRGKEVYIISACNSYELIKNEDSIYAQTGKHMTFNDYETYADFICGGKI